MGVFFSSLAGLALVIYLTMGIHTLRQAPGSSLNRIFSLLCLTAGLWNLPALFLYSAGSLEDVQFWMKLVLPFWLLSLPLLIHFFLILTERQALLNRLPLILLLYAPPLLFITKGLHSGFYIETFQPDNGTWYPIFNTTEVWTFAYLTYLMVILILPPLLLLDYKKKALSLQKQKQATLMLKTYMVGLIVSFVTDFLLPALEVHTPPLGQMIMLIWIGGIWQALRLYRSLNFSSAVPGDVIIQKLSDFVFLLTMDRRIEMINPSFLATTGWQSRELLDHPVDPLMADPVPLERAIEREQSRPGGTSFEADFLARGGSTFPVEATVTMIAEDQSNIPQGFLIVARDMSDSHYLKRLEQEITLRRESEEKLRAAKSLAEAANLSKNRFLTTMSHEMKTPLNAVIGMLSLVEETDNWEDARNYAATGLKSARELLNMINNVLEYSRFEEGSAQLEKQPLNIKSAVEPLLKTFQFQAEEKGLSFSPHLMINDDDRYWMDNHYLKRILINLLSNAFTFTQEGRVELNIKIEPLDEENSLLTIIVKDTGIGIPEEAHRQIFEYFYQVDNGMDRHFGGIGLGLSLVKGMVHQLEGVISLESRPGAGSRFTVTFPVQKEENS